MDALSRASTGFLLPYVSVSGVKLRRTRGVLSLGRRREFKVFAEKGEPNLDKGDLMELKFARLLGEDPKLTLAKILGKKANPDASYVEIEKSFHKNKGKIVEVNEVPFEVSKDRKVSGPSDGLELVRPVPKGVRLKSEDKQVSAEIRRPSPSNAKAVDSINKGRVPNVILRRPNVFSGDDLGERQSSFNIRPNLSLKMKSQSMKDKFTDMTLLRKPEPMSIDRKLEDSIQLKKSEGVGEQTTGDSTLTRKSESNAVETKREEKCKDVEMEEMLLESEEEGKRLSMKTKVNYEEPSKQQSALILVKPSAEVQSMNGMHHLGESHMSSDEQDTAIDEPSSSNLGEHDAGLFMNAELLEKPTRLDHHLEGATKPSRVEIFLPNYEDNLSASTLEDTDWTRAADLMRTGDRLKVELISSSSRGFAVSFGSLIGFLPYRNLVAKWKFLAFESWLRRKGIDPSAYRQNLGVIGSPDAVKKTSLNDPKLSSKNDQILRGEITPDMELEDLLQIYDAEKLKFLSSFVGQKIDAFVVRASKKARKLIFSLIREKQELLEKKRTLMAKLRVGDIVKCSIKKITYFGILVHVEGVPALVHQSEVSWDATLDPSSFFKIGQVLEARVHQLDFALERIFLSLKDIMPDPLAEALQPVVWDNDDLDGRLQVAQADTELQNFEALHSFKPNDGFSAKWTDVELLVKELEKIDGVESVSKGRFFLSPGLTPTFQVYMASMFENQYKLLARSGNKVQEVIVQASLSKEEMKSTVLSCTNRVE